MRILIVSNWFPPVVSGSSFYSSSLADALSQRGHEIELVTLDWGETTESATRAFPIHRLPVLRLPRLRMFYSMKLMGLAFTPANCRRIKAIVDRFRPDVVHHVNHIFDTVFLSAVAARHGRVPLVASITTPIQHQNPRVQRLMDIADRSTIGLFGVRRFDGIVSLDRTVHEYVGRVYGQDAQLRSVVIPFGVRSDRLELYRGDTWRPGPPQVVMVGHMHPFRNPVVLVRAMARVRQTIPGARLVLAGRIDLREPVDAAKALGLYGAGVEFRGETAADDAVRLMKDSHVFATWVTGPYPSLGTAPMEAMLCGTPVVSDLPENLFGEGALRDGENIMLVDSKDPDAVAAMLVRLLTDEPLRQRIGEGGRRFVTERLSWNDIASQMEALYQRLIPHGAEVVPAPSVAANR